MARTDHKEEGAAGWLVQDGHGHGAGLLKTWLVNVGRLLKIMIAVRLGEPRRDFPSWVRPWKVSRRLLFSFSPPAAPAPPEMRVAPCRETPWLKAMEVSFLLGIFHCL